MKFGRSHIIKGKGEFDLSNSGNSERVSLLPILCRFPLVENSEGKFVGGMIVEQVILSFLRVFLFRYKE